MLKKFVPIVILFVFLLTAAPWLWNLTITGAGGGAFMPPKKNPETFRLMNSESGDVSEIGAIDYITGCLFAQIPISYHAEALKAQAAAAYTYALRIMKNNALFPSEEMAGADISDDSRICQPYFTPEEARGYYGDDEYTLYYDKVRSAAEYGITKRITYGGEPIYAVYHSVSAGFTNTAESVWGQDFPYLKSVSSEWDKEYRNYECSAEMTSEKVRVALLEYDRSINVPVDYKDWFIDFGRNDEDYVESVRVGSTLLSGGDIWRILGLRSTSFSISYNGTVFRIDTKGYGHGAGMSQYGADYMAGKGSTAEEILTYYYSNVNIE